MSVTFTNEAESLILVVDDDPTTRMLMRESLQTAGFKVREAKDGEEAIREYHRQKPDMVLMDVVMPKLDGYQVCETIRNLSGGDEVPILMATSLEDMESINRAYEVGASDFVTKPINWMLLPHRVRYMVRSGKTYQKFRISEARNQALLDAIPDLMCRVNAEGRFLEIRPARASAKFAGVEYADQRHLRDFLPEDHVSHALKTIREALYTLQTQQYEFVLPMDGALAHFEARVVASGENEVMAIVRDITRRKQMEESLRCSEERFRSLIENATDLITILDEKGQFTYSSPAVERVIHFPPDGLVGRSIEEFVYEDDIPTLRNSLALARSGPGQSHFANIRFSTAEGMWRTMETICMSVRDGDEQMSIIVNSRDITERLVTESALRESEEQLRQSQKMEAIGRLAGGVAHDFNNLLTAILGYGQILDERLQADGQSCDEIQEVLKAGTRASTLTRQLLTFSRKEVNQPKVIDLNNITTEMEKMLRRLLGEDVDLETRLAPDLEKVLVDPGQMEQVVMNLAVNARDAMPGGGTLVIETENVSFDETYSRMDLEIKPGEYVMLAVSDNGIGIEPEHLNKIFEPFYTTKDEGKGTGLGLSTVYGIVKQHHGYIWTYSEVEAGTAFKIFLPKTEQRRVSVHHKLGDPNRDLLGSETVLIAEDEEWVRTLVRKCLEKQGYMVLEAENGEHALVIHDRYKGQIHLLLSDVVMPKMNGVDLAEKLSEKRPETRVVFMSGYTDHAALRHGRLQQGMAFLQKPFTVRDLALRVRDELDRVDLLTAAPV